MYNHNQNNPQYNQYSQQYQPQQANPYPQQYQPQQRASSNQQYQGPNIYQNQSQIPMQHNSNSAVYQKDNVYDSLTQFQMEQNRPSQMKSAQRYGNPYNNQNQQYQSYEPNQQYQQQQNNQQYQQYQQPDHAVQQQNQYNQQQQNNQNGQQNYQEQQYNNNNNNQYQQQNKAQADLAQALNQNQNINQNQNQNQVQSQNQNQQYNQQLGKFQQVPDNQEQGKVDDEYNKRYQAYQQNQQTEELINNIQPRTRVERESNKNKESIEKSRINARVGYEARNMNMKDLLQNPDQNSSIYVPETQRFDKDFAVYDKQKRGDDLLRREMGLEKKRVQGLERENRRWESIENQQLFEQQKREYQSKVLLAGKRNLNGLPYNPLTLQYDNTEQGRKLKAKDDEAKIRAYVRSQNLDSRSNSGFNVINGDNRLGIEQLVPSYMKNRYEEKIRQKDDYYSVKWIPEEQNY